MRKVLAKKDLEKVLSYVLELTETKLEEDITDEVDGFLTDPEYWEGHYSKGYNKKDKDIIELEIYQAIKDKINDLVNIQIDKKKAHLSKYLNAQKVKTDIESIINE